MSDTSLDELHEFAADLGVPPRAFHADHYDLPDEHRDRAVAAGAQEVSSRDIVRILRAAGLRRRAIGADKRRDIGADKRRDIGADKRPHILH